jgi:outer membrane lipoprotein SlyB
MRIALFAIVLAAAPVAAQERCANCGRVEAVRSARSTTEALPLGTMGSVQDTSGRVSTQYNFTSGSMVVLGAAGGAGYARRPRTSERERWEIAIRMDDGAVRTLSQAYEPSLRAGDRVRVYGTQVELAD